LTIFSCLKQYKSLIKTLAVTQAKRAHNCQNNNSHKILKGGWRLEVREGQQTKRYCILCAKSFLKKTKEEIEAIQQQLTQADAIKTTD
jgi:hypothetical protein